MRAVESFYWLRASTELTSGTIYASYDTLLNTVSITTDGVNGTFYVLLNNKMVDYLKPVILIVNGETFEYRLSPCEDIIRETTAERGDVNFQFSAVIEIFN
jgi:hypothetical protein